jgi:hypothetical protein
MNMKQGGELSIAIRIMIVSKGTITGIMVSYKIKLTGQVR